MTQIAIANAEARRQDFPVVFFDSVKAAFNQAVNTTGSVERRYRVGDITLALHFAGTALPDRMIPSLKHLEETSNGTPSLTVFLFDTESTGVRLPPAPWKQKDYGRKGEIAGFNTSRIATIFDPGNSVLQLLDLARNEAIYWVPSPETVPWWEYSFPMRAILQGWFSSQDLQLVHAGAVGIATGGVLIVGASGSGKSTTTLCCLDSPLLFAGDDYVLVDPIKRTVHGMFGMAKLELDNLARFPHLQTQVRQSGDGRKAIVPIHHLYPQKMSTGFPLRAILLPRITGREESNLSPASAADALRAIAPTTMFQLPLTGAKTFQAISSLVRSVPAWTLEAGTNLSLIPGKILEVLE